MGNYEVGKQYYIPVKVTTVYTDWTDEIEIYYDDGYNNSNGGEIRINDKPGVLLTAEEILTRTCEENGEPYIVDCLTKAERERDHYKSLCAQYEEILAQKDICIRELASMLGGGKSE